MGSVWCLPVQRELDMFRNAGTDHYVVKFSSRVSRGFPNAHYMSANFEGLEAGGPPGNPPKSGPERAGKDGLGAEAPGGPLEAPGGPLEAPGPRPLGGPWRAGCWEPPQNLTRRFAAARGQDPPGGPS